ncbi:integrin alpha-E isoform X2 [Talpa occidentalis]|uniref:integrin alpha-E isoform X2 n=1 Tax=Talpa occidentalis TaxID=50954 RepID=UPI0023F61C2D|nr:integrin alpha-E isoform X2 [Talpa occidentalis]
MDLTSEVHQCRPGLAFLGAFNVDVSWNWVTPKEMPFVLSSLLHQDSSTNQTWLLLTSPRTTRTSNLLRRCSLNDDLPCQLVDHGHIPKGRHRGVTVVRNHHGVLICIQVLKVRPHSIISELTGTCSLLGPDLRLRFLLNFPEASENVLSPNAPLDSGDGSREKRSSGEYPARWHQTPKAEEEEGEDEEGEDEEGDDEEGEDEEAGTEIAIVLDGSGSIEPEDFQRAKDFISDMMRKYSEKCFECSFALVQYGEVIQTEFDLLESQDVMATLNKVQNITQVGKVTKTASAMKHVLDNIFTPSRGSKKKASKVMVVLTDGDIFQDTINLTTVINSPQMEGVERFAIGVGEAFNKTKPAETLNLIASHPSDTHAFKVNNYKALDGLLGKLQQNIIRTEGTVGDALHYQLAQVGFSAQILSERKVMLGAVGAFDWSGGVILYDLHSQKGHFLNQTAAVAKTAPYSYLGYDLAVLYKAGSVSYVAGAPRHKQHGAVFELQDKETNFVPVLEGEQMGSYFGSELCPVDVDMDGTTDFLLVAAPFYHIHGEEGRVYVYRLNKDGSFSLAYTLSGHPGFASARFGFAMATVGDINQDKLTDVAIGAPMEGFGAEDDTSFGSVYIYNGRRSGLASSTPQRIPASKVAPGLHHFGVSLDGGLDITGDGLVDITVGTLGQAVVLRSRPVVLVRPTMNFTPEALPIGFNSSVSVTLCFEVSSATPAAKSGLRETFLTFTLDVDVAKQRKRWQSSDKRTGQSYLSSWSSFCQSFQLIPTEADLCEEDCFSNISVKVSYQLHTPEGLADQPQPVLDHYAEPFAVFQLPYEKDCRDKLFCIADLQLTSTISKENLVVGTEQDLVMNVSLVNYGEDSYMTSMTLNYPRNLHFKRIQKTPSSDIQCTDPKPAASDLVMNCKISHPIFKKSSANISVAWQLEEKAFSKGTANITVTVTNSNENKSLAIMTHSLKFKHGFTAVLPKPSVMYMNTSQGLSDTKEFLFNIQGENKFGAKFQLQICIPTIIQGFQILTVKNVTKTQASTECTGSKECACGSNSAQNVEGWHSVSCDVSSDKDNVTVIAEFSVTKRLLADITELQILGEISFDKNLYEEQNGKNNRTTITVIFLKNEVYLSLPLIIGSSVGAFLVLIVIIIILVKCGFFKRKYQQKNLEKIRKAQMESENLLTKEY